MTVISYFINDEIQFIKGVGGWEVGGQPKQTEEESVQG